MAFIAKCLYINTVMRFIHKVLINYKVYYTTSFYSFGFQDKYKSIIMTLEEREKALHCLTSSKYVLSTCVPRDETVR
jgi:hypothetical protein